ncbi:MAG: response regulator [Deltaproteobacteria bacterium]|nr:response regulator [Deltaproteobacteria bacterium]
MSDQAKILFVDDEEAIRSLILTVLEGDGHAATGAGSAAEAEKAFETTAFDLAVIDKNLPDGSGIDLLRDQKKKHPETEFIILTGYPSLESAIEALRAGAFDYLIKPVLDLDLVTQKVNRALERRRLLQQVYGGEGGVGSDSARLVEARTGVGDLVRRLGELREALGRGRSDQVRSLVLEADEAAQALAKKLG